jgi:ferredoxin
MSTLDALRTDAAALLRDGRARLVIGYRARGDYRAPVFVTNPDKVDVLTCDSGCLQNLAAYLRKPEVRHYKPVAIVARPAVMRSLVILAAESQVAAGDVVILGVGDDVYHGILDLKGAETLLKEKYAGMAPDPELVRKVKELAAMTPEDRAAFWARELAKCTRCYACRAACPMCYCTRCIVEKNVPQWISTAARSHGNYAWNVIRAFHLAGRCTECGACEAACPQGIPLMLLAVSVAEDVAGEFGGRPGYDLEAKPVIGSFSADDSEDFIR